MPNRGQAGAAAVTTVAPSADSAERAAIRWVASTGSLLTMGPIRRRETLAATVASRSFEAMSANLDRDLSRIAAGLPIPVAELRLVETPLTATTTVDAASRSAVVSVWSVAVFGAEKLGAPRVAWRTNELQMVWEANSWKLAAYTATAGPTPVAADGLPADWEQFATVSAWRHATQENS